MVSDAIRRWVRRLTANATAPTAISSSSPKGENHGGCRRRKISSQANPAAATASRTA
jgi:hypothetical protein